METKSYMQKAHMIVWNCSGTVEKFEVQTRPESFYLVSIKATSLGEVVHFIFQSYTQLCYVHFFLEVLPPVLNPNFLI